MKLLRKRVSFKDTANEAGGTLRDILIEQPKQFIRDVRERARDLPRSNFELACKFATEGKWFDAVFRFRVVLRLKPGYPNAHYNLGGCYLRMGKLPEAKAELLKALAQTPNNPDVLFMLSSVDPNAIPANQRPTTMPLAMVTGFFGSVAEGYDVAEAANKYQAGKLIYELAKPSVAAQAPVILDLGCGSGIAARPWRMAAAGMHGVDVTPAMAALAQAATHVEKKLYDSVTVGEVSALPSTIAAGTADVVLAVNMAQFVGDLSPLLKTAAQALKAGGVLAITTEPTRQSAGYGIVQQTGRFGHAPAYVKQAASAEGFALIKETPVELYAGVPAQAYLFSKGQ